MIIDKKSSRYKFLKRSDTENPTGVKPMTEQNFGDRAANMARIMKYKNMWDAMSNYRRRRERIKNYERGLQWNDKIEVGGKVITEAQHIKNQGKIPLQNNVMLQTQNSIVGEFRKNYAYPEAVARTKDNQEASEMMTAMLQFVSQINDIKELDVADFMEGMRGGLAMQSVDYHWDYKKQKKEMFITSWNPTRIFLPSYIEDPRGEDIDCLGVLMDMTVDDAVSNYAKSAKDEQRIRDIYKYYDKRTINSYYNSFGKDYINNIDFALTNKTDKIRVIQAWELQSEDGYMVHDKLDGSLTFYPLSDGASLRAMKAERDIEIELDGLDPEKSELDMWRTSDKYWYVRYLSPFGDSLFECRTPFNHKSHPFAIYMSRLVDGELFSLEESIIDQQRYINRLVTLIDFIIGASAKGVLVFPENAIPKGMNKEDILEQWTSYRGVIFANLKPGMQMPQQISSNATNVGANELLAMQLQFVRDISGTHGAMLGREGKSGQSATGYAMEATNGRTNIIDIIESFNAFRKRRDYLIARTLPQCYDKEDYIPVIGREHTEKAMFWDNVLMSQLDYYITIVGSLDTEAYETEMNKLLSTALQQQLIDFETALEAGRFPFSDRVLRVLRKNREKQQQEMAQAQAQQMQAQAAGQQMFDEGASQAEVLQAGADAAQAELQNGRQDANEARDENDELNAAMKEADPKAMELIAQALGR